MRQAALKDFIKRSALDTTKLGEAVRNAVEVGVVVPSILERNLQDLGYTIKQTPGAAHGVWIQVTEKREPQEGDELTTEDEVVVAQAFSSDKGDALLQAIYAELKTSTIIEEEIGDKAPTSDLNPTDETSAVN